MDISTPNFFPRNGPILNFWAAHPCHSADLVPIPPPGVEAHVDGPIKRGMKQLTANDIAGLAISYGLSCLEGTPVDQGGVSKLGYITHEWFESSRSSVRNHKS